MLHRLRLFIGRLILWFAMPAFTHEMGRMTPQDWTEVDPPQKPDDAVVVGLDFGQRPSVVASATVGWELSLDRDPAKDGSRP